MSLSNVHYPYAIKLPSPEITHLTDIVVSRNQQILTEAQAGAAVPCFVGVGSTDPTITFTTRQIKSVLDAINVEGVARDMSAATVDTWYRAGKPMAVREDIASSLHIRARMVNASMLFWSSLTAVQDGFCEIAANIVTAKLSAGSSTLAWLGAQAAPARTGCERVYGLGPCFLDGVQLQGVTGFTLSSGVALEPISADGVSANVYQGIRSYHVTCELQMNDITEIHGSSLGGDAYGSPATQGLELYLRKRSATNTYDANDSGTHIKITLTGGLKVVPSVNGSPGEVSPMFYAADNGHAWDTSASIT